MKTYTIDELSNAAYYYSLGRAPIDRDLMKVFDFLYTQAAMREEERKSENIHDC